MQAIVASGPPPGLLAFDGKQAVGWCQLTPRSALPALQGAARLEPVDDVAAWCISCFYVRKGHRKQGVTQALIEAAIQVARKAGAAALEGYPLDPRATSSASFTGFVSTFERLGFREVARRHPARPVVRIQL